MTFNFPILNDKFLLMAPAAPGQQSDPIMAFLPLILIVGVFYFMILRPQKKRQKEREALVNQMEKGDKVITSGGIHGTVSQVEEGGTVLIQVSETTKLRMDKSHISQVNPKNAAKADA